MKNFKTYQLAVEFFESCQGIKFKNKAIKDQFERASLSICLSIAEGWGRITEKDRRRFYGIALGSLRETQCLLHLMKEEELSKKADILGGFLYQTIRKPGRLIA